MDAPVVADEPVADEPVTNNARQDTKKFNARHALIFGLGGVALISTASMSMLIGIHVGRQRAMEDFVRSAAPLASSTPPKSEAQAAVPPPNATPTAAHATDVPNGSLLIYQEGKEVLRQVPPAAVDRRGSSVAATHASAVDSHPPGNTSSDPLNRVEPEYPPQALQDGIQGPVVLDLYIDKDGSVQRVSVVSGPALLADAATTAVKQWRFRPRVINSRQVSMQTRVTVRFSLPKP
jgi:TonB family protein